MPTPRAACLLALLCLSDIARAQDHFVHLERTDPYYPSGSYPRLITPQWIGEEGVEAAIVLSIDDLRAPEPYERFLRPILERLKEVEGRAPLSVFVNSVDTAHPLLQQWLEEGLSLEVHTIDHPCPLLHGGDLPRARSTFERCVDLLNQIPGTRPVAYRMPCCDSINSNSPRFYAEVFAPPTASGNHLDIDSSVFSVPTLADAENDAHLLTDEEGRNRFLPLLPADRSFANTNDDYPYPYPIGRLCWELPMAVPSDWQAQHHRGPNHPETVEDLKAALDLTVAKRGVFTLVFHPHNWIQSRHIIELIDHAVAKHGRAVRFLNFHDVQQRLDTALFPLRDEQGRDAGVRILDLDADGYMDAVAGGEEPRVTRRWIAEDAHWEESPFPVSLLEGRVIFGAGPTGEARLIAPSGAWRFLDGAWKRDALGHVDVQDALLRDLDGDGISELIVAGPERRSLLRTRADGSWERLGALPPVAFFDSESRDAGVRLVDLDGDGYQDLVASNEHGASVHRLASLEAGWSGGGSIELPPITVAGRDRGAWFHSRHIWWQNEDTAHLPAHVDRRSFAELLAAVPPAPRTPQDAARCIQVPAGLRVELVAAEPLIQDPIAFDWDASGRLFVVEMGDYPLGSEAGGRVRLLSDDDGDGTYDRASTFLDGLRFPTGVAPWRDGVLITCAPEILFARDSDGDGRADEVKTLFSGFGEGNQQHRVNGLWWGLDNWYHGANGDSGGLIRAVGSAAQQAVDIRGRDFRLRPDTLEFEAEAGQTQFGKTRDDWGRWFGGNNSNACWHFPLAARYLARAPEVAPPPSHLDVPEVAGRAPVYPLAPVPARFNDPAAARHFTSACSPHIYRDSYLPCTGNLFVCEPVHNLVHRELLEPAGVSFRGRRAPGEEEAEFLTSTDPWFRPVMVRTGPDGALWVADMARHVIEHPEWIPDDQEAQLDLREGHQLGRLYRVVRADEAPRPIPDLAASEDLQLVKALESPGGWLRDTAQRLLVERGSGDGVVAALEWMANHDPRPTARLHALCTLEGLGRLRPEVIFVRVADEHPHVVEGALRLAEPFLQTQPEAARSWRPLVASLEPRVRLQLAASLGEAPGPRATELLTILLATDGGEPYLRAAALSSIGRGQLGTLLQMILAEDPLPEWVEESYLFSFGELWPDIYKQRSPDVALKRTLVLLGLRREDEPARQAVLTALTGTAPMEQRLVLLDQVLGALAETGHGWSHYREGVDEARLEEVLAYARSLLQAEGGAPDGQELGLRVLSRTGGELDSSTLAALLGASHPAPIQLTALELLAEHPSSSTARQLLQGWRGYTPALRERVLDALLARRAWADATLDALADGRLPLHELDASRRDLLALHVSPAQRARAESLTRSDRSEREPLVSAALGSLANQEGDAVRGREFFQATCSRCHRLDGQGESVGPDLRALGDRSTQALVTAILDPNRAVEARFLGYTALTTDERVLSGLLVDETATSVTLRDAGVDQVLLREDLQALACTGRSQMPEGLELELPGSALADLVEYLQRGVTARTFPGNEPRVLTPAEDGSFTLSASACEIFGPSLAFESRHRNLGFWHAPDDLAAWTLDVPATGSFTVVAEFACPEGEHGDVLVLETGATRLDWRVASTGGWDEYESAPLGTLQLGAGRVLVTVHATHELEGYLIDLRQLRLLPVK